MNKKTKIIIGVAAGVVVLGILVTTILSKRASQEETFQTEVLARGDISVTVGGTGNVRADQSAVLIWQTGGRVENVHVSKGQVVQQGEVLATLDPTSVSQGVMQAQVDLINAQEALDNAINNTESRVQAHLALIQAEQALEDAEQDAASKQYQRATQETIDIAKANLINAQNALDKAEENYNSVQKLDQDSPIYAAALSAFASARQNADRAEYNLAYAQGLPDPLEVEKAALNVQLAQAQLLTARQNWEKVADGPDATELLAAQTRVNIAQATVDMAHLEAPFAGTITAVNCQPGDLVNAGSLCLQVDDLSRMLVDIDISEVDINQVQVGQTVSLTFDAIPNQDYTGVVSDIAWVGASLSGSVNYTVTVELADPTGDIKPGMTVAAYITVTELQDVLLVPSRAVRTLNGARVVYVMQNNIPVPVEIVLGASASTYSQVIEGDLQEGDVIVLNPPTDLLNFGMGGGMR